MDFRIRPATAADVPAMHAVRRAVRENRLSDPGRVTEASYLPYVADGSAWVAETDAGVAGFAAVDLPAESVWALFVSPGAEGAGIGRALHGVVLDRARRAGLCRLRLGTEAGTRAERFYLEAGWTRDGTAGGETRLTIELDA